MRVGRAEWEEDLGVDLEERYSLFHNVVYSNTLHLVRVEFGVLVVHTHTRYTQCTRTHGTRVCVAREHLTSSTLFCTHTHSVCDLQPRGEGDETVMELCFEV